MTPIAAQQVALDNALVVPENQVQIGKCNMKIDPIKTPKEPTYQVVLDALTLSPLYPTFLITTKVPICPRLPNQEFVVPLSSDPEIVSFIKDLGYTGDINFVTKVYTYHMHQPWRTFAAVINRCLSGKTTGLDKIRLSTAQILWGCITTIMYYIHDFFDKDEGTLHWRSKRKTFYGYASNMVSKHDVYFTKRILAVTNVKVDVWYGYGHLDEIEVRRSDQKLYKFMEGDFPRLYLNDIEDVLLLVVQNKLFNLKGKDIVHLTSTLRMFTRRIVIQKRVEDLQLGVESYQKKLNISRPLTHRAGITDLEPYTTYSNSQGVIYLDKLERNILMCSHELYKFNDGTLISVPDKLKDMLNNLKIGYTSVMPRRRWRNLDKERSCIMVKDIDRQLLERRLMSSLEKFVGGREYGGRP
ncbi:hypothetical protein Tco_0798518 [Tanacetum coccineum]